MLSPKTAVLSKSSLKILSVNNFFIIYSLKFIWYTFKEIIFLSNVFKKKIRMIFVLQSKIVF